MSKKNNLEEVERVKEAEEEVKDKVKTIIKVKEIIKKSSKKLTLYNTVAIICINSCLTTALQINIYLMKN